MTRVSRRALLALATVLTLTMLPAGCVSLPSATDSASPVESHDAATDGGNKGVASTDVPVAAPSAGRTGAGTETQTAAYLLKTLVERLEKADRAMRAVGQAVDLPGAQREARLVLALLVGPRGRHAVPTALVPGVLPADGPAVTEPGLALDAYDASVDPSVRGPIEQTILGNVDRWRVPSARWDEIDAAVAGWTPQHNPMPGLDGHLMRVIGWSLLTLQAPGVERAHEYASHGVIHTSLSLRAAEEALSAAEKKP